MQQLCAHFLPGVLELWPAGVVLITSTLCTLFFFRHPITLLAIPSPIPSDFYLTSLQFPDKISSIQQSLRTLILWSFPPVTNSKGCSPSRHTAAWCDLPTGQGSQQSSLLHSCIKRTHSAPLACTRKWARRDLYSSACMWPSLHNTALPISKATHDMQNSHSCVLQP